MISMKSPSYYVWKAISSLYAKGMNWFSRCQDCKYNHITKKCINVSVLDRRDRAGPQRGVVLLVAGRVPSGVVARGPRGRARPARSGPTGRREAGAASRHALPGPGAAHASHDRGTTKSPPNIYIIYLHNALPNAVRSVYDIDLLVNLVSMGIA